MLPIPSGLTAWLHAGRGIACRRHGSRAVIVRYGVSHRPVAGLVELAGHTVSRVSGDADLWLELLSAFSGMERENINRGVGWLFLSIGRRLERAIYLTRQLREITKPLAEQDWPLLECLLEVATVP
jgi:hypothetical protein